MSRAILRFNLSGGADKHRLASFGLGNGFAYNLYRGVGGLYSVDFSTPVAQVVYDDNPTAQVALGHSVSTRYTYVLRPVVQGLETPDVTCRTEFETDGAGDWVGNRPNVPVNVTAEVVDAGQVRIRWKYKTGTAAAYDFGVYYSTDPGITRGSPQATELFTVDGRYQETVTLTDGVVYYIAVTARTSGGVESSLSPIVGPLIADATAPATPTPTVETVF